MSLKVDLIEEYIKEHKETQRDSLPGPPPPPQDLHSQTVPSQSPRSVRQSARSNPVLVARGATCKVSVYELFLAVLYAPLASVCVGMMWFSAVFRLEDRSSV